MSKNSSNYSKQQAAYQDQQISSKTGLSSQQRSKIQGIIEKGQDLQRRISDARSDIRSNQSNDSFKTNDLVSQKSQQNQQQIKPKKLNFVGTQQNQASNDRNINILPISKNYSLIAQTQKARLDAVEDILQEYQNQPKIAEKNQNTPQSPTKPNKKKVNIDTVGSQMQLESDSEPELYRADSAIIQLDYLLFSSSRQIVITQMNDIDLFDFSFSLNLQVDGLQQQQVFKFDLKQKLQEVYKQFSITTKLLKNPPKFGLYCIPELTLVRQLQTSSVQYIYALQLNINKTIQYFEGAGLQIQLIGRVETNSIFCQLSQQNFLRSPYQQLTYAGENVRHDSYLLRNQQYEVLKGESQTLVTQLNQQNVPNIELIDNKLMQQIKFVPIEISFSTIIGSSQIKCDNLVQQILESDKLEARLRQNTNILLQYQQASLVQHSDIGTQFDKTIFDQDFDTRLEKDGNLMHDPITDQYYCSPDIVSEAQQIIRHDAIQQQQRVQNAAHQFQQNFQEQSIPSTSSQLNHQSPLLFINKIELQRMPVQLSTINSISVQFINEEQVVQKDIPLIDGNALLTGDIYKQPISRFVVPPLNIKIIADGKLYYVSFTLENFANTTAAEGWVDLQPAGRLFIKAVCLPPICLNLRKNDYTFVDCNGRECSKVYAEFKVPPQFGEQLHRSGFGIGSIPVTQPPTTNLVAHSLPNRLEKYTPFEIDDLAALVGGLERAINRTFQSGETDSFNTSVIAEAKPSSMGVHVQDEQSEASPIRASPQHVAEADESIDFDQLQVKATPRAAVSNPASQGVPRPMKAVEVRPPKYQIVREPESSESDVDAKPRSNAWIQKATKKIFQQPLSSSSSSD